MWCVCRLFSVQRKSFYYMCPAHMCEYLTRVDWESGILGSHLFMRHSFQEHLLTPCSVHQALGAPLPSRCFPCGPGLLCGERGPSGTMAGVIVGCPPCPWLTHQMPWPHGQCALPALRLGLTSGSRWNSCKQNKQGANSRPVNQTPPPEGEKLHSDSGISVDSQSLHDQQPHTQTAAGQGERGRGLRQGR